MNPCFLSVAVYAAVGGESGQDRALAVGELLLEKIFEGTPRVFRAYGPRSCIALLGHAERKEDALVVSALVRDTLWNGLGALKPVGGIEVGALPAGMQLGPALGALAEGVGLRRE